MSDAALTSSGRFLRIRDVVNETSLSRATIYRMIARGEFPSPIKVSTQRVAWVEGAVQHWKNQQAEAPLN
jgi:prophage regulatory protein